MTADPGELASAAGALFAALAAAAAWAAVRLNWHQWRSSQLPDLRAQAVHVASTGNVEISILNAGGGVARGVGFCVVFGEEYVAGFAGPHLGGFLQPGELVVVDTDLNPDQGPEVRGVVTCDDVIGYYHSWRIHPPAHHVWRTRLLRRPLKEYPSGEAALRFHHPEIDLDALRRVKGRTKVSRGVEARPQSKP